VKYFYVAILTLTSIVAIHTPVRAQSFSFDIVNAGVSVFNSLVNPPHRAEEVRVEAEIKKAKINAQMELDRERMRLEANKNIDRAAPVLNQWGATRVPCTPGAVFLNGVSTDTVCINPSNAIPAGYYSYSAGNNLLVRSATTETKPAIPTAPLSNYASNPHPGF
jgi:hypothetical protein